MIGIGLNIGNRVKESFSPLGIPNLKSWHDATQGVTLVGGAVDVWADQSGNGWNVNAVTSTQRAQYGLVTLNGNNVLSSLSGNVNLRTVSNYGLDASIQGATIFFVGSQYAGDQHYGRFVSAQYDKQFWTGRNNTANEFNGSFLAGLPPYGTPQAATDGVFYTAMYLGTTTSLKMSLNGGALPTAYNYSGTYASQQMSFFNEPDNSYSGSQKAIAECIIYNRTLTSTEYNKVIDYLRTKWGHY